MMVISSTVTIKQLVTIGQVHLVWNPSDSDFDDDSDAGDFGQFDDEFDEYGDNVTSDMEENKLFTYTEFSYTIDVG